MPIYDYACSGCGREFEVEQRIAEDPLKTCPHCRSRKVKRLISQTSFVLKGGGWYSDLYSSAKGKGADKEGASAKAGDDKSGGDDSSGGSSKGDSKKSSKSDSGPSKESAPKSGKGGSGSKSPKAAA